MFELAQQSDVLWPAEVFLDPFSLLLADGVAGVASGAVVDGLPPRRAVLRHVQRHVHRRHSATNSVVSKPLSPPTLMRPLPGIRFSITRPASRSARPWLPVLRHNQPVAILHLQLLL